MTLLLDGWQHYGADGTHSNAMTIVALRVTAMLPRD